MDVTEEHLVGQGFDVKLNEILKHRHDYYRVAASINKEAWDFLKAHKLADEPKYKEYVIGK